MNKEEIEAIENLEHIVKHWKPDENDELANIEYNSIKVAVNLIDKLQKENESKNKQIKLMQEMNLPEEIEINYISKDKIRNKIKELEKDIETHSIYEENWNKIEVLKELLGE